MTVPYDLDTAVELFSLSGFEPSPRAAFGVHCTALEQLFQPQKVDAEILEEIERMESQLDQRAAAATSVQNKARFDRLKGRLGILKRYSIAASVQEGVTNLLASDDTRRAEQIKSDLRDFYTARNDLARQTELGDLPRRLQTLLQEVILARLRALHQQGIAPPRT